MKKILIIIIFSIILLGLSRPAHGTVYIALSESPYGDTGGFIQLSGVGLLAVHVIIYDYSHTGLSQISFSVPVPECLNDAVFLGGVFNFPSDGSPESGVTVYLGGRRFNKHRDAARF